MKSPDRSLTLSEQAGAIEARLSDELDAMVVKSNLYTSCEEDPRSYRSRRSTVRAGAI